MKHPFKSGLSQVLAVGLVVGFLTAAPAQAAPDDFITPNDGVCNLVEAGLGNGAPSAPFQIGTVTQLAEIDDCDNERTVSYTAASSNGSVVTYTANHDYGVGQPIRIQNSADDSGYNFDAAVITAVTATTFSIRSTKTLTTSSSGDVKATFTHFELANNIDLSTKYDGFNENDNITVTGLADSGNSTIIIQGANSLDVGQTVYLDGFNPTSYNYKTGTVVSANSTSFEVDIQFTNAYVSGGQVVGRGWTPLNIGNAQGGIELDGNGFTLSNMSVYRPGDNKGLFDALRGSTLNDLIVENFTLDIKTDSVNYRHGLVTGKLEDSNITGLELSGQVTSAGEQVSLVAGAAGKSNIADVKVTGTMNAAAGYNRAVSVRLFAGVAGNGSDGNYTDIEVDVDIDTESVYNGVSYYGRGVAAVVGQGRGTLSRIKATGSVNGQNQVGGVAGYYCCGDVSFVESSVDVFAFNENQGTIQYIGGLLGEYGCCGAVRESVVTGDVNIEQSQDGEGVYYVGGALGSNWCCSTVAGVYVESDITILEISDTGYASHVGGVTGVSDCCNYTDKVGYTGTMNIKNGEYVGGIIGYAYDVGQYLSDSYAKAQINVTMSEEFDDTGAIGGIVGYAEGDLGINRVFFEGGINVTSVDTETDEVYAGGILGYAADSGALIRNSYVLADISVQNFAAGIVGGVAPEEMVDIRNTYFVGDLDIREDLGFEEIDPLVNNGSSSTRTSNFFNSNVTTSYYGGISKTLSELKNQATFTAAGYDFSNSGAWRISAGKNQGHPHLNIPMFLGGGSGDGFDRERLGQSNKFNRIAFGVALENGTRRHMINLSSDLAGEKFRVQLVRNGKVHRTLKTGVLNSKGNSAFKHSAKLKKDDIIRVKVAGKRVSQLKVQ